MAENIKPTRSELMKLKNRIKLAKSGYNLLKKKRDGLILEFFEILKRAKTVRQELTEEYKKEAEAAHINVVIAGHMSSDSIGLNLFLDQLKKRGIKIIPCAGLIQDF